MSYQSEFLEALKGYQGLADIYAKGGGYGAGQYATIESEAKKSTAKSTAELIASGMSSGSQAVGMRARVSKDTSAAKLGVEDVRSGKYAEALSGMAGLRATYASTMAQTETAAAERALRKAINEQELASTAADRALRQSISSAELAMKSRELDIMEKNMSRSSGGGGGYSGGVTSISYPDRGKAGSILRPFAAKGSMSSGTHYAPSSGSRYSIPGIKY